MSLFTYRYKNLFFLFIPSKASLFMLEFHSLSELYFLKQ